MLNLNKDWRPCNKQNCTEYTKCIIDLSCVVAIYLLLAAFQIVGRNKWSCPIYQETRIPWSRTGVLPCDTVSLQIIAANVKACVPTWHDPLFVYWPLLTILRNGQREGIQCFKISLFGVFQTELGDANHSLRNTWISLINTRWNMLQIHNGFLYRTTLLMSHV